MQATPCSFSAQPFSCEVPDDVCCQERNHSFGEIDQDFSMSTISSDADGVIRQEVHQPVKKPQKGFSHYNYYSPLLESDRKLDQKEIRLNGKTWQERRLNLAKKIIVTYYDDSFYKSIADQHSVFDHLVMSYGKLVLVSQVFEDDTDHTDFFGVFLYDLEDLKTLVWKTQCSHLVMDDGTPVELRFEETMRCHAGPVQRGMDKHKRRKKKRKKKEAKLHNSGSLNKARHVRRPRSEVASQYEIAIRDFALSHMSQIPESLLFIGRQEGYDAWQVRHDVAQAQLHYHAGCEEGASTFMGNAFWFLPKEVADAFGSFIKALTQQLGGMGKPLIKMLEDVLITSGLLLLAENRASVGLIILQFISRFYPDTPICTTLYDLLMQNIATDPMECHSGLSSKFSAFIHHPVIRNASIVASALVAVGFVSSDAFTISGYNLFRQGVVNNMEINKSNPSDLIETVLVSVSFFLETGYQCFVTRSFKPYFEARDRESIFLSNCTYLNANIGEIEAGNYTIVTGKTPAEFQTLLVDTKAECSILSSTARTQQAKTHYQQAMAKLMSIESRYTQFSRSSGYRIAPYCVKLYGASSVGKTTLNTIMMKTILAYNNFPNGDDRIGTFSPTDKFMSNAKSDHTGVIIDDLCNSPPDRSEINPAQLLIQFCGNVFTFAPMAEAEKKGKISIEPMVVGITTNNQLLDAHTFSCEPASILRRCHVHATVRVRPEFCKDKPVASGNSRVGKLDSEKVLNKYPNPGDIPDIWLIDIERLEILDPTVVGKPEGAQLRPYLQNLSVFEFIEYLYKDSAKHFTTQRLLVRNSANMEKKMHICCECHAIEQLCRCAVYSPPMSVQSGFEKSPTKWAYEKIYNGTTEDYTWAGLAVQTFFGRHAFVASKIVDKTIGGMYRGVCDVMFPSRLEKFLTFPTIAAESTVECILKNSHYVQGYAIGNMIGMSWWHYLPDYLLGNRYMQEAIYAIETPRINRHVAWLCSPFSILAFGTIVTLPFAKLPGKRSTAANVVVKTSIAAFVAVLQQFYSYHVSATYKAAWRRRNFATMKTIRAAQALDELAASYDSGTVSPISPVSKMCIGLGAVGLIVASVKLVLAAYRSWKQTEFTPHGSLDPTSFSEINERDRETTVWSTAPMKRNVCTGYKPNDLARTISCNLVRIKKVGEGEQPEFCDALMIKSNVMAFPFHMWLPFDDKTSGKRKDSLELEIVRANTSYGGSILKKIKIEWASCRQLPGMDLVFAHMPALGTFTDLTKFFPTVANFVATSYISIYRNKEGIIVPSYGNAVPDTCTTVLASVPISYACATTTHEVAWSPGDCMTVLISDRTGPEIIGLHLMGFNSGKSNKIGKAITLTQKDIENGMSALEQTPAFYKVHSGGDIPETVCKRSIGYVNEINRRSPINWLPADCTLNVFGSCAGGAHYSTGVRSSKIMKDLEPHFGKQRWAGPRFSQEQGGGYWKPWAASIVHMANPCTLLSPTILQRAQDDYLRDILPLVDFHSMDTKGNAFVTRKLSDVEILAGVQGVRFIDAMNVRTSMGFPLSGAKMNYMKELPPTETHQRPLEFEDPVFFEEVKRAEERYLLGTANHFIFKACLKDEPTPIDKEKVRVFQAAPIVCQLLIRKYFLPLARILSIHPLKSECAVGINAFSLEWDELHKHITKFGKNIFAGDYSKWDLRLPAHLVLSAFDVFIQMARRSGTYSADDLTIMRGIATDIAYPIIAYNGTLLQLMGGNPSGQNLTAYVNSICNSLLVRVGFYSLGGEGQFRQQCAIMTYGDDVIGSVCKAASFFNHMSYAGWLSQTLGMSFTMPNKKDEPTEYMDIADADFLKRLSTFNADLGCYIGILNLESIYKSLYCVSGAAYDENNIICSTITSALHELFFHGRDVYDTHVSILTTICRTHKLIVPGLGWSYDDRVEKWKVTYISGYKIERLDDPLSEVWLSLDCKEQSGVSDTTCAAIESSWVKRIRSRGKKRTKPTKEFKNKKTEGSQAQYLSREMSREDITFHSSVESAPEQVEQPVVSFVAQPGEEVRHEFVQDDTFYLPSQEDAGMEAFLARPLKIANFTWDFSTILLTRYNLWDAWLNNKRIINRIGNYTYITGTMCLKVMVNGSPFHYGKAIVAIDYWPQHDTVVNGTFGDLYGSQVTCLPHISVDPCEATGGCLEIPLYHPYSLTTIGQSEHIFDMIFYVVNNLTSANNIDNPVVEVSFYVWMKDVTLSAPTTINSTLMVPQSGNEYGTTPVAMAASLVKQVSRKAQMLPIFAPYAKATEIVASSIGSLAYLFGFSRPNALVTQNHVSNQPIGNLSNYNYQDSSIKLALDCKNEVTVDPGAAGLPREDEMTIASIASRPVLWQSMTVDSTLTTSSILARFTVNPILCTDYQIVDTTTVLAIPPITHAAKPFRFWRGSIDVRFEFVASKFHKGKFRIVHEPAGALDGIVTDWTEETHLANSYIVDLSVEREYTLNIPWAQRKPYLRIKDAIEPTMIFDSSALPYNAAFDNGSVGVHMVTPITGPANPTSVYLNVYISAGPDFEVACPAVHDTNYQTSCVEEFQSGLDNAATALTVPTGPSKEIQLGRTPIADRTADKLDKIFIGERILSIRQLMKRYQHHHTYSVIESGYVGNLWYSLLNNNFPHYDGSDPNGINVDSVGNKWNFNAPHVSLNWFAPAYLAWRGGLRHKYILHSNTTLSTVSTISSNLLYDAHYAQGIGLLTGVSPSKYASDMAYFYPTLYQGAAVNIAPLCPCLEFETPFYSDMRFDFAQSRDINAPDVNYPRRGHVIKMFAQNPDDGGLLTFHIDRYIATAEDFSLMMYKYPPLAISRPNVAPP